MYLIETRDVWFTYDGVDFVLRGVSIGVSRGEVVALLGPTGSGKTTLLMILAGLFKPTRGEVLLEGRSIEEQLPGARRRLGILFQNPDDQLFNPTVYDEVAYALRTLGLPEEEVRSRVLEVARELGITSLLNRPPYRLSMGQKQLVALASILVYEPDILLLDEPTAFLDDKGISKVKQVVEEAKRSGRAVILATHDINMVLEYSDKACLLVDGSTKCVDLLELERLVSKAGIYVPKPIRILERLLGGWKELVNAVRSI